MARRGLRNPDRPLLPAQTTPFPFCGFLSLLCSSVSEESPIPGYSCTRAELMTTGSTGTFSWLPFVEVRTPAMRSTTSIPWITFPNTA
jgi:hypothetical protein